jgi:hypothetical protein
VGLRGSKRYPGSESQLDVLARPKLLTALRKLIGLTLVLVACQGDENQQSSAPSASASRGPDAIALRASRTGGIARAALLSSPDSIIWRSGSTATISKILGFDGDAGVVAYVDKKGIAARIDLRSGEIRNAGKAKLSSLAAAPGSDIYGVDPKGTVIRLSPAGGEWSFVPPTPASAVFTQSNGSIIVAGGNSTTTSVWLLRPPEDSVYASAKLSDAIRSISAVAGDRLYFASDNRLVGVRLRTLETVSPIRLPDKPAILQPTPSGDRIYVGFKKRAEIAVVDRYEEKITQTIKLPDAPSQLRIDPLGRYLLAKVPDADSVWVIALGTNRLMETQASAWTNDLPAFGPEGKLAVSRGDDVLFIEPESGKTVRTVVNGAKDFWFFFTWNGFRPRAEGVDEPVTFGTGDSTLTDSSAVADSVPADTTSVQLPADTVVSPPQQRQFTVSFAALLRESSARELANTITVNGNHPKVVQTVSNGAPIFRVVLGPFGSREEAERVGRQAGHTFWVYEGYP